MALNSVKSILVAKNWTPLLQSVRFRYWKDQQGKGPLVRRYGYKDNILPRGLLAHTGDDEQRIRPIRVYRPSNSWLEKKALFGQNDYIDILGDGSVHPTQILYELPVWVRGASGNEYQMLLRKRKWLCKGDLCKKYPTKWRNLNERIKWLYTYMNNKVRTGMPKE